MKAEKTLDLEFTSDSIIELRRETGTYGEFTEWFQFGGWRYCFDDQKGVGEISYFSGYFAALGKKICAVRRC